MSLYYEAEKFLAGTSGGSEKEGQAGGSLKARIFNAKNLKSTPSQVYALVTEASKWSSVLKEVIERAGILKFERKITPILALLLVHDLLLVKRGIAAPEKHVLRVAVEKYKARLRAEFTKERVKRGCGSLEEWRIQVEKEYFNASSAQNLQETPTNADAQNGKVLNKKWAHPRWVRVNTLKTTLETQLATTFSKYRRVQTIDEVLEVAFDSRAELVLHIDLHIPNLIALPSSTQLSTSPAYQQGLLILQDKASCFPAYLLDPKPTDGDVIDACAAPGNKTTHLAALLGQLSDAEEVPRIWAYDKDKGRAGILKKIVNIAGADKFVTTKAGQDFLRVDPNQEPWSKVGAVLLDPSCSGSGIVGRDDMPVFSLPVKETAGVSLTSKKRKRKGTDFSKDKPVHIGEPEEAADPETENGSSEKLRDRLKSLSAFQTKLLLHALSFPCARKVSYSTCSIHEEENEGVILAALESPIAQARGWRLLLRNEQVFGVKTWLIRGDPDGFEGKDATAAKQLADACIRCRRGSKEGTQGFFVACFVRYGDLDVQALSEEEWEGFGDE
ncbi:MAG: hypothetical protein MMC33_002906 [Icmadophila ericetorum]|nr:hypothetical protein [Icmadophila ericetorum]